MVDNGSEDGSVSFLKEKYPEVDVIAWRENLGFSVAVNAGIRAATAPLVFLLNNDTELDKDCLQVLVNAAKEQPDVDFFAVKMLQYKDRSLLDGAGDAYLRGGAGYRVGTMEPDSSYYSKPRQVFGACAGAALYRKQMLLEIGLFDEDFFAYLEDVDLNLRANSRGRSCWYVPEAGVYHIGSATSGSTINAFTVSLSTRNSFFVILKNYPLFLLFRFAPVICIYQFLWFCFTVKRRQLPAYIKGVAGLLGQLPKLYKKRKSTLQAQTATCGELSTILRAAENDVVISIMARRSVQGKGNLFFRLYQKLFL